MTFRQIELFVLVCQYKSIAKVSELNFVSPQSVSRMIKDLETEFNCNLFHRTKSGIIPTETGAYIRNEFNDILNKKNALIRNIEQKNRDCKQTITIGMALGSIAALNYHIFDNFQIEYPHIEIQYSEFIDSELEERFLNDEFDFSITTKPLDTEEYHNIKILTEQVYLSIPQQHGLYTKSVITMADLQNHEFAMFTDAYHIQSKFMNCFNNSEFTPNIKVASTDFNSIKNLAYQNNLLSLDVQHSLKKEHGFRHVLFPCSDLTHDFWMIRKKRQNSDMVDLLCQYIQHSLVD